MLHDTPSSTEKSPRAHRGTSLIELIIFIMIIGMVVVVAVPLLFSATENRILQQTISLVEQNGTQILQNISLRVRNAERILTPSMGGQAQFLSLQTSSGATNPTIIGLSSGSIVIVERAIREKVSSEQVAVRDFFVQNTSVSASRQSVRISFMVSRTIRLQQPHSYSQRFEAVVSLLPHDELRGNECSCASPSCGATDMIGWEVCMPTGECNSATTHMECP